MTSMEPVASRREGTCVESWSADQAITQLEWALQKAGLQQREYTGAGRCVAYVLGDEALRSEPVMIDDGSLHGRVNIIVRPGQGEQDWNELTRSVLSACGINPDEAGRNNPSSDDKMVYTLWRQG